MYLCSSPVHSESAALHLSNTMQGTHLAELQVISCTSFVLLLTGIVMTLLSIMRIHS